MQVQLIEIKRFQEQQPAIRDAGVAALHRLLPIAQGDTGQSGVVALFLLGLYNGRDFKFDLTELRRLDHNLVEDCLALLRMDSCPEKEVHSYFENGKKIWQSLRKRWASEQDHLFAEIKATSKYAYQVDSCRNGPCGYPFKVHINAIDGADGYIVGGGWGGRYRLEDVDLFVIVGDKKICVS